MKRMNELALFFAFLSIASLTLAYVMGKNDKK
jgi:hypothetical protein